MNMTEHARRIFGITLCCAVAMSAVSSMGLSVSWAADEQAVISWGSSVEIASGGGQRGPWRQNESNYDYVDDPTVALDAQGATAVVWVGQRRKDIFFQIYERDGKPRHNEPVNVSRSPRVFSWLPRLVVSPKHPSEVFILWQEIVFSGGSHGGETFFARSLDGALASAIPSIFRIPLEATARGGSTKISGTTAASTW